MIKRHIFYRITLNRLVNIYRGFGEKVPPPSEKKGLTGSSENRNILPSSRGVLSHETRIFVNKFSCSIVRV